MPSQKKRRPHGIIATSYPAHPSLPKENEAVLAEFDQLLRSDSYRPFTRDEPDKSDPTLRWDIVGDADRNWLYVVVTKVGRKQRFAKVTDDPGGFSIGSQRFGIDAETLTIAGEMADEIVQKFQKELAR
jgi:hypothetical protein